MNHPVKNIQLFLHRHYKHVNYVIAVVIGLILLTSTIALLIKVSNQNEQLTDQGSRITELVAQNRALTVKVQKGIDDAQVIAKQTRAYSSCIAELFAKYTQTYQPIMIVDLNTCTTSSTTQAVNDKQPSVTPTPQPSKPDQQPQGTQQSTPPPKKEDPNILCTLTLGLLLCP